MKRRTVLGGGLVVAFGWRGLAAVAGDGAAPAAPGSLKVEPHLDGWIRVDAAGRITVCTGKAELGQGVRTALLQVAAEELQVAPAAITLVTADTERTPNEGYTAGSHSMQDSGTAIRRAAAQMRALLVARAAERLSVATDHLKVENGVVASGGTRVGYGELATGVDLHIEVKPDVKVSDPKTHRLVGTPMPRIDIPAKVSGGAAYVQDLRLPGMVHGRVVRPPTRLAALRSVDAARVEALPGVLKVVRDGRFLAVIAEREFQAVGAARALAAAADWDTSATTALPAPARLYDTLRSAPSQDDVILERGDGSAGGAKTIEAVYERPYQMHGSIGPSCAIAQRDDGDRYTLWTHTQGVFPQRKALAELLGVPEPQVHCIHVEGSGCYGHNGADDVAADAALLARALPGRPVRLQWMREDEHGFEPLGPPMTTRVIGSIDGAGKIVQWQYEVWSNTHNGRPGGAGDMLAGPWLEQPFKPSPPRPIPQPEGGGDRNAIPLYLLPNAKVTHHFLPDMPLRVSALRSLGAYMNVFSIESFVDELARAAGADPVALRLAHLGDARAIEVVKTAAERFGWAAHKRAAMRGRGFAFARYKNLAAYCAIACEVEVRRDSGEIRILRVVAAVDSGEVVNPDGIRNQIEGGIVQSASWTTVEEAAFDAHGTTARDWGGYPILRFMQVPLAIDVHIVARPGAPFLGTGEAAQGPAAAAIANAVADATGVRMRSLPLSRGRVREAVGA